MMLINKSECSWYLWKINSTNIRNIPYIFGIFGKISGAFLKYWKFLIKRSGTFPMFSAFWGSNVWEIPDIFCFFARKIHISRGIFLIFHNAKFSKNSQKISGTKQKKLQGWFKRDLIVQVFTTEISILILMRIWLKKML